MSSTEEITTLEALARVPEPVGLRVALARKSRNMSVPELAAHLGVTPASVRSWEAGERTPRANRMQMLAGILDVPLTWLLEGREDERMAAGGTPNLDQVYARLETARSMFAEALALVESAQRSLASIADAEDDPDPSEVED